MVRPLPFTWPYALIFWAVYTWVFIPEFRLLGRSPLRTPAPAEDRGSLRVVVMGFNVAAMAAFVIPFVFPQAALPGNRFAWFYAGIVTLVAGSLLRRHCFKVLGRFFTGAVKIQEDHRVIESGAYRWVGHPSYSAALLIVLGMSLSLGSWLSVVVAMAVAFFAYSYRARVEEQALLAKLGAPYAQFMSTRKRFVPYVF
jgi:protein-S-isoprenylcysteine O-methyltransferase Ste14